ncbi:hypothetical protein SK128_014179 [Halocaridina rubra]|uniref:Adenosine deaminase domain-containing protein n=1 Tax=Halocaridina rubra TaxID=373956 RepID=A0AAN8WIR0_HALRR
MDLKTFCRSLPKIELHAHLTGSLSDATVLRLLHAKRQEGVVDLPDSAEVVLKRGHNRTLKECFEVFRILHCLTDNLVALRTITRDVIREFVEDNVQYLELRTTPKVIIGKMTKEQYIETVLDVIGEEMKANITIRLLLSVDRARGVDDAWDTLRVTKQYMSQEKYKNLICGLDISGNPNVGDLCDYIPVLEAARKDGLKLAVHVAEVLNEKETLHVLKSGLVSRVGHGSYIHHKCGGTHEMVNLVKNFSIPIEICISSNIKSGTVKSISDHHFQHWWKEGHPVIICTDDKGVFNTSLSEEFQMCAETFKLTHDDLCELCLCAVDSTFLPRNERDELRKTMQQKLQHLRKNLGNS